MSMLHQSKLTNSRQEPPFVARTGSPTCPVAIVERYFAHAGLSSNSNLRLYCGIVHAKSGDQLRATGSLSYTRMRELILEDISQLDFNPKFGLHSHRAGGATAAANAGVANHPFKRHGHWWSESAKNGYVKDSVSPFPIRKVLQDIARSCNSVLQYYCHTTSQEYCTTLA